MYANRYTLIIHYAHTFHGKLMNSTTVWVWCIHFNGCFFFFSNVSICIDSLWLLMHAFNKIALISDWLILVLHGCRHESAKVSWKLLVFSFILFFSWLWKQSAGNVSKQNIVVCTWKCLQIPSQWFNPRVSYTILWNGMLVNLTHPQILQCTLLANISGFIVLLHVEVRHG